jgi:DNA-binding response OmpR family regulator
VKKKILIVEDEEDILCLAKVRLESANYRVLSANNTKDAMNVVVKHKPDLILLDLLLPGERGEEFCKRLKADMELKKIPVILFTATAHSVEDKIKETGADDGIMQPFNPKTLLRKIDKLIK